MTIQDLKKWHKSREEEDVWWIQIEGETLGRKVNLEKIEQILDKKFDSEVMVLHVSKAAQRPRPWVEVERVKAAPAEKPHDDELDGKEITGAYSGEREPRPPQNVNFYPSQGNPIQTPVSDASLPSALPPSPAPPAQRKKKPKKGGVGGVLTTIVIFGLITILARTCGSKVGGDLARKHSAERGRENTYSDNPSPANGSLVTFQAEMNGVEKLLGEYQSSSKDLLKALKTLTALDKGMSQIKTTGLPKELASSFNQYRTTMSGLSNHLENTPFPTELLSEGTQGISRWIQEQDVSNPGFIESYKMKMDAWEKKGASYQGKTASATYRLSTAMQRNNIVFDFSIGTK